MQTSLKKSLYLGLAALSFGAIATVSTTASAKSYATAGAYQTLTAAATDRNVEATGTNALYSKPGTVKGAKVVASKTKMATLAASKKSADYFRAYGVKTTNRGSVYFKVVSMDGKYRGYVYGGKSTSTFAGGIKSADTTTAASLPTQTNNYYLKDSSANTIWSAPKYTQYQAKKVSLLGASKTDKFTIDKAVTKTREGSLYYHVTDASNSAVTGWIYAGGLTTDSPATAATTDNSITVKYVDSSYNTVGSAQTWTTTTANTKKDGALSAADLKTFNAYVNDNVPAGYAATTTYAATSATYGSTVQVEVSTAATSKVSFKEEGSSTSDTKTISASDLNTGAFPSVTSALQKSTFTGKSSDTIDITTSSLFQAKGALYTLTGAATQDADGNYSYKVYTFDPTATQTANKDAKYGTAVTAYYTSTTKSGKPTTTTTDTGNTDYVG